MLTAICQVTLTSPRCGCILWNSRVADIDVYLFLLQLHRWLRTECQSSARLLWMA